MAIALAPEQADIDSLLAEHSGIRLDIGCGANKMPGCIGLDIRPLPGVDIVQDVTRQPWPLPDESVIMAVSSHVVEHIPPHDFGFIKFMDEVWRVMKFGGEFWITCPHGRSNGFIQDPTHCNPINETTWAYFAPEHPSRLWSIYQPKPWRIKALSWSPDANIEIVLVKINVEVQDDSAPAA